MDKKTDFNSIENAAGAPFFSVIVVCYNAGNKLRETVDGILAQTCGDYEIIVKDAGSADGSVEQLPQDSRICCIRRKDSGIYDGMNQALSYAAGQYIYFLNCGDSLHDRDVLQQVKEEILKNPLTSVKDAKDGADISRQSAIFYGDVIEMQTGQLVAANPRMDHFAMYRYLPSHQACFYSRDLLMRRGFDTAYRVRGDYEHFLWCIMNAGAQALSMPLVIADYEGGGYSESQEGRILSAQEHRAITAIYFTRKERAMYRAYLILSLQPLRKRLAQGRYTAALYDRIKNRIYGRK